MSFYVGNHMLSPNPIIMKEENEISETTKCLSLLVQNGERRNMKADPEEGELARTTGNCREGAQEGPCEES